MTNKIPLYNIPKENLTLTGFKLYTLKKDKRDNPRFPNMPLKTNIPHRHNFYEVCIFFEGQGYHEIDFKKFAVTGNSIHFISPGQVHLISMEGHCRGYIMAFTREFLEMGSQKKDLLGTLPYLNDLSQPFLNLSAGRFRSICKILKQIKKEYVHPLTESEEVIRHYLHIFLLKSKTFYGVSHLKEPGKSDRCHLYHHFKALLELNFHSNQKVQDYANLLGTSPARLNRAVKKSCGLNASELILERITLEAKRLLVFSDLTNKEIAYQLGYKEPSYFSRIFKKKTKYAPSDFRALMHEKYQH